ncbi:MAG: hypothetical protein CM15mP68_3080 [Pseudomonadota bacterium]|nr:MAG: hypothetical protein CM15mP68_3080 [Pseudomonadota bacterium]
MLEPTTLPMAFLRALECRADGSSQLWQTGADGDNGQADNKVANTKHDGDVGGGINKYLSR